jgi:hypothetical protein
MEGGIAIAELNYMTIIQNFDNRNNVLLSACVIMARVTRPIDILPESAGLFSLASYVE